MEVVDIEDEDNATMGDNSNTERSFIVSSEGKSLRGQTRNYPQRISQNMAGTSTTEDIKILYGKIGNALAAPNALCGSIALASEFSEKAQNVSHFYKNKWVFGGYAFCFACTIISMIILLTAEFDDELISVYLFIPMLGPLVLSVLIAIAWRCVMSCSGSLLLRSRLESLEEYLELCEINSDQFEQIIVESDHGVCDYRIVGSAGDGFGFFPSQGSNKHIFQKQSVLTQDIDMNIFINSFVPEERHLDREKVAKGFTWIRYSDEEHANEKDPVLRNSLVKDEHGPGYLLKAKAISQEVRGFFRHDGNSPNTQIIEHYPALTLKTSGHGPNGLQEYEVDYAFALRCPEWPKEAEEWKMRERFGLDQKTVDHIVSRGCYLVHKSCGNDKPEEEHELDWRFTFASAEADLFHYHRDKRALRLAFVILKFMIKMSTKTQGMFDAMFFSQVPCEAVADALDRVNKEISVLRTYHLKTVFLWMAEQETILDYYTIKGNKTLGKVFLAMINQYTAYIESGCLPNYFMKDRNMLDGIRYKPQDFTKALKLLKDLKKNSTWKVIILFEIQFVNKKALATVAISLILIVIIVMNIALYFQFTDLANSVTPATTQNYDTEIVPEYNYKIFSQEYQQFISDLYNELTNSTARK